MVNCWVFLCVNIGRIGGFNFRFKGICMQVNPKPTNYRTPVHVFIAQVNAGANLMVKSKCEDLQTSTGKYFKRQLTL